MNKAVVDTTILTDVLLNTGEVRANALNAISHYDETYLPVYAIKEFKAGPLKNFVWMLLGSIAIFMGVFGLGVYREDLPTLKFVRKTHESGL